MSNIYTPQELIQILATERQACLKGHRLKLAVKATGNPLIDMLIKTEGLQKFTAYQDFKSAVHNYQKEYQVSGIIWRQLTVKNKTLQYPEVDTHLISLPSDLEILKAAKNSAIEFWYEVTDGMDLYLSFNNCKEHQLIQKVDVERIAQRTEWATLLKWENPNMLEIILQMGWGKPEDATYKRGWPASGSEYIHAVNPGNYPIG